MIRLFLILSLTFLIGCASTVKLDPGIKSKLSDGIAIEPPIRLTEWPKFYVSAVPTHWSNAQHERIKDYLAANKIDVASLVVEEFRRQINNDTNFSGLIRDDGKYRLVLTIDHFGLVKNGLSIKFKPILGVKAKMTDPLGRVVWEYSDFVTYINSDTLAFYYEDYYKDPETFRTAFTSAAKVVVSSLINNLK
ncbi:MAG: hypothetical protein JSR51_06005 [Proteobacteria bacterium]|nr:hypothetical protein [Pseudomonadota bacterium]